MIYGSVCSGIEAATQAWHPLGWNPAFFSEIDTFPRKVLQHHYPRVPLHGDFTTIKKGDYESIELLVGGTPCQSFSVAGLRAGLNDPRGNLMLEFGALAKRLQPKWLVWENVPGVLSSNRGKDFGSFLAMLAELGYGFSYRVLDAQFVRTDGHPYAVPQRRRRVFVIGCFGSWQSAAAVFFDRESLQGNTPPRKSKGQKITSFTASSFGQYSEGVGTIKSSGGDLGGGSETLTIWPADIAPTLNASFGNKQGLDNQHINSGGGGSYQVAKTLTTKTRLNAETESLIPIYGGYFDNTFALAGNTVGRQPLSGGNGNGNGNGYDDSGVSYTLTKTDVHAVAFGVGENSDLAHCLRSGASKADKHESTTYIAQPVTAFYENHAQDSRVTDMGEVCITVTKNWGTGGGNVPYVQMQMQVRRLTPIECARLQGFPDNYLSQVKGANDSAMYKALGNSMAVNVMQLIGQRIELVEKLQADLAKKEAA